jgi:hypothetical protein
MPELLFSLSIKNPKEHFHQAEGTYVQSTSYLVQPTFTLDRIIGIIWSVERTL